MNSNAQQRWLQVGDQMPDITLDGLVNYSSGKVNMSDLKDKLVIVDIWGVGCTSCIQSFPHLEELQKEFNGRVQIITLTKNAKDMVDQAFQRPDVRRFNGRLSTLPSIFGDTAFTRLYRPFRSVPEQIWIGPGGEVLYITNGYNATRGHIQAVLAGERPFMLQKIDLPYDTLSKCLLSTIVGGSNITDIRNMSFISGYSAEASALHGKSLYTDSVHRLIRVDYDNVPILSLISAAFIAGEDGPNGDYGALNRVIWSGIRPDDFFRPDNYDSLDIWTARNVVNYEQVLPLGSSSEKYPLMQEDVSRYLKSTQGIKASIITVRKKCLVLYSTRRRRLPISPGGTPQVAFVKDKDGADLHRFVNTPFKQIVNQMYSSYHTLFSQYEYPLLDETTACGNVDMEYILTAPSIATLDENLHRSGLKLAVKKRRIKMLKIEKIAANDNQ